MRPTRHQESRTSEARDSCCLPARRLWNLDLPPPTSHQNVRLRVPGMTTPAISLSLLSFPSRLPDPLHRLQRLLSRLLPQPHNLAIISTLPTSPNPKIAIVLSFSSHPQRPLDLHALHSTCTQPLQRPIASSAPSQPSPARFPSSPSLISFSPLTPHLDPLHHLYNLSH